MTCKECDERAKSSASDIDTAFKCDTVRDIERMRAVVDRLAAQQAETGWKADYAYRNVHRHASTWDVLLWTAIAAGFAWCVWTILFGGSDDAGADV